MRREVCRRCMDWVLELLFPPRCPVCGAVLPAGGRCGACADALDALELGLRQMYADNDGRLLDFVDSAAAYYRYEAGAREIVHQYKFGARPALAGWMAQRMAELAAEVYGQAGLTAVLCVPAYRGESGHGQRLARAVAKRLGLPFREDALVKIRRTEKQHELDRAGRAVNLQDAFEARAELVSGARLLLCDDVITSGATMNECARALKRAGAAYVFGLAFASAARGEKPAGDAPPAQEPADGRRGGA